MKYYRYWKSNYPQLKVSKPSEDICILCYPFAQRHKMLADHKRNGTLAINADNVNLLFQLDQAEFTKDAGKDDADGYDPEDTDISGITTAESLADQSPTCQRCRNRRRYGRRCGKVFG
jgi:hypothetical protein